MGKGTEFIVNEKKGVCAYRDQSPVASGRVSVDSLTNNVFFYCEKSVNRSGICDILSEK